MIHPIDNYSDYIIYHRIQPSDRLQLDYLCCPSIYMIPAGTVRLFLEGKSLSLTTSDIMIINSYEGFSFQFQNAIVCQFIINLPLFEQKLGIPIPDYFEYRNLNNNQSELLNPFKSMLVGYIHNLSDPNAILDRQLLAFEIFHYMTSHFAAQKPERLSSKENASGLKHIQQAMNYMQHHYKEPLTVQNIADHCYVSIPYLSRLFKEHFNKSIFNILTQIRLANAWTSVMYSKNTIESIASNYGFSNARAFSKAFFEQYGDYPSRYREQRTALTSVSENIEEELLKLLVQYQPYTSQRMNNIYAHVKNTSHTLKHHLWNILFIGDVRHISVTELKKILPPTKETFGYTCVYISGLLSQLMLQTIATSGSCNPLISFVHTDAVLDIFIDAGFIPCIDLYSINHGLNNLSYYTRSFLEHYRDKYGIKEIEKWFFILGYCPLNFFGDETTDEALDFKQYKDLMDTIKMISPCIQAGSPLFQLGSNKQVWYWFIDFLDYTHKNNCIPDFYSIIHYPISHGKWTEKAFTFSQNETLDNMEKQLSRLEEIFLSRPLDKRPIYIIEWNTSISNKDYTNDSIYKAAQIFKTLLENYDRAMSFGYSMFHDSLEMFPASPLPIHGGKGLICNNGVKKPAYWALLLLRQMGDQLICRGHGYFITRKEKTYQIYLYNETDLSTSMAADNTSSLQLVNIINSIPVNEKLQPLSAQSMEVRILSSKASSTCFNITLDGLDCDSCTVTAIQLKQQQCSIYTQAYDGLCICPSSRLSHYWNCMTTPQISCDKISVPKRKNTVPTHLLELKYILAPGEIAYIEINEPDDYKPLI